MRAPTYIERPDTNAQENDQVHLNSNDQSGPESESNQSKANDQPSDNVRATFGEWYDVTPSPIGNRRVGKRPGQGAAGTVSSLSHVFSCGGRPADREQSSDRNAKEPPPPPITAIALPSPASNRAHPNANTSRNGPYRSCIWPSASSDATCSEYSGVRPPIVYATIDRRGGSRLRGSCVVSDHRYAIDLARYDVTRLVYPNTVFAERAEPRCAH